MTISNQLEKKEAMAIARNRTLVFKSFDMWKVKHFEESSKTFHVSPAMDHPGAILFRSQKMVDITRSLLGLGEAVYKGGDWRNYLNK
jgi:hypothetical protein